MSDLLLPFEVALVPSGMRSKLVEVANTGYGELASHLNDLWARGLLNYSMIILTSLCVLHCSEICSYTFVLHAVNIMNHTSGS